MSDILIRGMEMPTSCGYCPFENHTDDGYECRINGCLTEYQIRPSDCPLVEIPPHGDLIDRTKLIYCGMNEEWTTREVIEKAPTIIGASEEGRE